jgi:hypothetical protein
MTALDTLMRPYLTFIDDDVAVASETLEAIRTELAAGAQAVGVRIEPDFGEARCPAYLVHGLWHYIGVHTEATLGSVWGACFGLDGDFVRTRGLAFEATLGRRGGQLQSGDDTTFVQRIRDDGGRVVFRDDVTATHQIRTQKCRLSYLLRRAWWQGRSEARRGTWLRGVRKELRRLWTSDSTAARLSGVLVFGGAVIAGMAYEALVRAGRSGQRARTRGEGPAAVPSAQQESAVAPGRGTVAGSPGRPREVEDLQ